MVATSCFLRSSLHSLNVRLHTTITCMLKFRQLMQFSDCVWSSLGSEMEGKTTHGAIANELPYVAEEHVNIAWRHHQGILLIRWCLSLLQPRQRPTKGASCSGWLFLQSTMHMSQSNNCWPAAIIPMCFSFASICQLMTWGHVNFAWGSRTFSWQNVRFLQPHLRMRCNRWIVSDEWSGGESNCGHEIDFGKKGVIIWQVAQTQKYSAILQFKCHNTSMWNFINLNFKAKRLFTCLFTYLLSWFRRFSNKLIK